MRITVDDAQRTLNANFPKDAMMLERFPFGKHLATLWSRQSEESEEYRNHAPKVLQVMNSLLDNKPNDLLGGSSDEITKLLDSVYEDMKSLFGRIEGNIRTLFQLGALYHDIGKYIIKDRHPTVGWYTMEYLDSGEKNDLRFLLGDREDLLQLLMVMIRDHDEFGVLSTGEASYPILLNAATSLGSAPEDQKRTISAIMWLNLADMAGTPGMEFSLEDMKTVIKDWKWFLVAVDKCAKEKQRLDDYVIREASSDVLVEQRICRLLLEGSRKVPSRLAELRPRKTTGGPSVNQMVKKLLRTVYPTQIPRNEFASQFTHICKLDYCKRFLSDLVLYCEGPNKLVVDPHFSARADERVDTETLIYAVFAILRRMTSTYLGMIRSEGGHGNLIGVEMKDLTPKDAEEKTARMIKLLLDSHYPGLSWMMSDCLAWYF